MTVFAKYSNEYSDSRKCCLWWTGYPNSMYSSVQGVRGVGDTCGHTQRVLTTIVILFAAHSNIKA